MDSIRIINLMENKNIEYKKKVQNKIEVRNNIALTKGVVPEPRKRQFIKKGILGLLFGAGIIAYSKMTKGLQAIEFADASPSGEKLETWPNDVDVMVEAMLYG